MSAGWDFPDFRLDFQRPVVRLLESGHAIIEFQPNAMLLHVALNEVRHFGVQRRHDLIELLDQCHFESAMDQVFDHLQADEPAAHDHRPLRFGHRLVTRVLIHAGRHRRLSIQPFAHVPGIRYGSDREDSRKVNAGQAVDGWEPPRARAPACRSARS